MRLAQKNPTSFLVDPFLEFPGTSFQCSPGGVWQFDIGSWFSWLGHGSAAMRSGPGPALSSGSASPAPPPIASATACPQRPRLAATGPPRRGRAVPRRPRCRRAAIPCQQGCEQPGTTEGPSRGGGLNPLHLPAGPIPTPLGETVRVSTACPAFKKAGVPGGGAR